MKKQIGTLIFLVFLAACSTTEQRSGEKDNAAFQRFEKTDSIKESGLSKLRREISSITIVDRY